MVEFPTYPFGIRSTILWVSLIPEKTTVGVLGILRQYHFRYICKAGHILGLYKRKTMSEQDSFMFGLPNRTSISMKK